MRFKKGSKEAKQYMANLRAKKSVNKPSKKITGITPKKGNIRAARAYNKEVMQYKYFILENNKITSGWEFKEDALDIKEDNPEVKIISLNQAKKLDLYKKFLDEVLYDLPKKTTKKVGATLILEKNESIKTKPKKVVKVTRNPNGTYKEVKEVKSGQITQEKLFGLFPYLVVITTNGKKEICGQFKDRSEANRFKSKLQAKYKAIVIKSDKYNTL